MNQSASNKNQSGFTIVEIGIVVAVIVALALVGNLVFNRVKDKKAPSSTTSSSTVKKAQKINDPKDLDTSSEKLETEETNDDATTKQEEARLDSIVD